MNKKAHFNAFSLIELMIVVAIIGILAAIAIPNYMQYQRRSRVGALLAFAEAFKPQISEAMMAGNGTLSLSSSINNDANVQGYTLTVCSATQMTLKVTPTAAVDSFHRQLGLQGTLNADGSVSWACGTDIASRPASCGSFGSLDCY